MGILPQVFNPPSKILSPYKVMHGLPECKPGDYLECDNGAEFSRVLVLSKHKVLVKEGVGTGEIIPMAEWLAMMGESAIIHNASYFETCRSCPLYRESEELPRQMSIRTPSMRSVTISDAPPIVIPATPITPIKKLRTPWYYRLLLCCLSD